MLCAVSCVVVGCGGVVACGVCVCVVCVRCARVFVCLFVSVCGVVMVWCVHSNRPRVCGHHAHMCFHMWTWYQYTRGRFERTHGPSLPPSLPHSLPPPPFSNTHTQPHTPHTNKKKTKTKEKKDIHMCLVNRFQNNHNNTATTQQQHNTTQLNTEHVTQKQREENQREEMERDRDKK